MTRLKNYKTFFFVVVCVYMYITLDNKHRICNTEQPNYNRSVTFLLINACSYIHPWARHSEMMRSVPFFIVSLSINLIDFLANMNLTYIHDPHTHYIKQEKKKIDKMKQNVKCRITAWQMPNASIFKLIEILCWMRSVYAYKCNKCMYFIPSERILYI